MSSDWDDIKNPNMQWYVPYVDQDLAAALIAVMLYRLQPEIDVVETAEIIEDFMTTGPLNDVNVHVLVAQIKSTMFNPNKHKLN